MVKFRVAERFPPGLAPKILPIKAVPSRTMRLNIRRGKKHCDHWPPINLRRNPFSPKLGLHTNPRGCEVIAIFLVGFLAYRIPTRWEPYPSSTRLEKIASPENNEPSAKTGELRSSARDLVGTLRLQRIRSSG